jgi:N-carbamoyl-L-amino-acid hydrolase
MPQIIKANVDRLRRDVESLSEFTDSDAYGYTRISFSLEDRQARNYIRELMEKEAGLNVYVDAAGNMIGRREGKLAGPCIMVGSHLDTVPGGGRFDGIVGVVAGLEVARGFEKGNISLRHPLEVVIFLAEEPSPFGISTVGSRGMTGKLSNEILKSLEDPDGRSLFEAIQQMGGAPSNIAASSKSSEDILAYIELHIEQGSSLFSLDIPVGVVTGIVGIHRGNIQITGRIDHSGTTPMEARRDALAAASEAILSFEEICKNMDGVVGTFGRIEVFPNSLNVVPGSAVLGMDLRSLDECKAEEAIALIRKAFDKIEDRRDVLINSEIELSSKPVIFDTKMVKRIGQVCSSLRIPFIEMPSGAGHDAGHIAELAPVGMIFIPSKDGRSHCPDEWSEFEHICFGTEVLAEVIVSIDKEEQI